MSGPVRIAYGKTEMDGFEWTVMADGRLTCHFKTLESAKLHAEEVCRASGQWVARHEAGSDGKKHLVYVDAVGLTIDF